LTQFASGGDGAPLAAFDAELQLVKERAEEVQERLRTASSTVRAPDGAVTVTVGASGVLQGISFGARAYQRPPEALSALVMQLVASAQKAVSAEVSGAFADLVGEGSTAMAVLQEFLPERDDEEDAVGPATPPPPPAAPVPPRQQPPRRPAPEDDEDEDNNPW
jgi:DNA-binding protein YbaB